MELYSNKLHLASFCDSTLSWHLCYLHVFCIFFSFKVTVKDKLAVTKMNVFSDLQNDVARTIQFDDSDDCIQPSKITGSINVPQVDIACVLLEK